MKRLFINGAKRITDDGIEHLVKLSNLEEIDLFAEMAPIPITDAGLEHIGKMSQLKRLRMSNLSITDAGLKHLQNLHGLEYLFVRGKKVTNQGMIGFDKYLPDCWILLNDKPVSTQAKRLEIYETHPQEKLIKSITDQERIAKIIDFLEFSGWEGEYKDAEFSTRFRLDFKGRNRCLYQVRLEKGRIVNQYNRFHAMSADEEKELFGMLEIETDTKPSP